MVGLCGVFAVCIMCLYLHCVVLCGEWCGGVLVRGVFVLGVYWVLAYIVLRCVVLCCCVVD